MQTITCEHPESWLWQKLALYENETLAKRHLERTYAKQGIEHPQREAFKNTDAFCAYLQQGRLLFHAATNNHEQIHPLFLYYGLINLLKAVLLQLNPTYPQHTSLLQHGCSTRKRKRRSYQFLYDDIRIQKEGLFPYAFQQLYGELPSEKAYPPKCLFGQLPDLQSVYTQVTGQTTLYPLSLTPTVNGARGRVSEAILDRVHLTLAAWLHRFHRADSRVQITDATCREGMVDFQFSVDREKLHMHPWLVQDLKGEMYLWIDPEFAAFKPLPELASAYLLLFALSMLVRYDPPLWMDMWNTSAESALLSPFFTWIKRKTPQMILEAIWGTPLKIQVH